MIAGTESLGNLRLTQCPLLPHLRLASLAHAMQHLACGKQRLSKGQHGLDATGSSCVWIYGQNLALMAAEKSCSTNLCKAKRCNFCACSTLAKSCSCSHPEATLAQGGTESDTSRCEVKLMALSAKLTAPARRSLSGTRACRLEHDLRFLQLYCNDAAWSKSAKSPCAGSKGHAEFAGKFLPWCGRCLSDLLCRWGFGVRLFVCGTCRAQITHLRRSTGVGVAKAASLSVHCFAFGGLRIHDILSAVCRRGTRRPCSKEVYEELPCYGN